MKKQTFLGGVAILFLGGVLAKVLGAFYKIPLTWTLGTQGLGFYQLIFPLFSMLLIVSSTGMPTAISWLVSKHKNLQHQVLKCSLKFMLCLSAVACVFLLLFAKTLAGLQGCYDVYILYYLIAPAIIFVSVISAFRGFYQGKLNMLPTTLSNVIEQLFKLVFGLSFAAVFVKHGVLWGAFGAVLGVVVSELIAMLFLIGFYILDKKKSGFIPQERAVQLNNRQIYKQLFKTAMPIVLSSVIIPLSLTIDSVLVVNLLTLTGFDNSQSISLWGISCGVVNTLVNLPVTICACVATALVPHLSAASSKECAKQKNIYNSLFIVLLISLPFCVCFMFLPNEVIQFLFSQSLGDLFFVASKMLALSGPLVLLICLLQTQTAILQGQKQLFTPVINLGVAVILKTVVMIFAIRAFSVYGIVLANFVLYVSATILNRVAINKVGFKMFFKGLLTLFASAVCFVLSTIVLKHWLKSASVYLSLPLCLTVGFLVFGICLVCLNAEKSKFVFLKIKANVYKIFFGKKLGHKQN